ncbi:shikimate dehydrogenase [candidate division KSB1 bacterium]|nr:shikimate dehydrogenase [candidate division KSB1 bacterium]
MISASTNLYAVIGDPVAHSLSPVMQNWFIEQFHLNAVYTAFRVKGAKLQMCINGMRAMGIKGLNVTVPHKEAIRSFVDEQSEEVRVLGAANTLKNQAGVISAYVTDPYGFIESLGENRARFRGASVLLYGAGGAAKSVSYALSRLGVDQLLISDLVSQKAIELAERAQKLYGLKNASALVKGFAPMKEIIKHTHIVINATAVGMFPLEDKSVVDNYDVVGTKHFFYDLVYNPAQTKFLRLAEERGAATQNGLDMLIYQGLESLRIWTGQDLSLLPSQLNELKKLMRNQLGVHE